MTTARAVQRTYLVLMLGNTLAASFIWGINTIFLLDAGLSNLEAFAANAFFTAGMVLFEVPTGIVADSVGRRASYLLGTVTLTRLDAALRLLWEIEAPFWAWALASLVLGLGLHVLLRRGRGVAGRRAHRDGLRRARWRRSSGAGRSSAGRRCSPARSPAACSPQQVSLGFPFVLRAVVLAVMFVVAFVLMHDIGFTPPERARPPAGRDAQDRDAPRSSTAGACPP